MITVEERKEGHREWVVVTLPTEFNFIIQREFRNCYESRLPKTAYEIDFKSVSTIDSSALGMLLLLRNHCGESQADIRLLHCNSSIMNILKVSKFDELFQIG